VNLRRLEKAIDNTRNSMEGNWTTHGLKINMQTLLDQLQGDMQQVVEESERTRKLMRGIYKKFQDLYDLAPMQPKMFSIMPYRVDLDMLHQEAEVFRKSPITAMTEKHFVVKRFFLAMVSRARDIFFQARQEIDIWLKSALDPLRFQIQQHKEQMDQRLEDLQKISRSRDTLNSRMAELDRQRRAIAKQVTYLCNLHNALNSTLPLGGEERPRPRLIQGGAAIGAKR
ncbi:MAG: hypothetical protein G8D28_05270, partial [gamma proteobacterium symbiont of Phacoides pectinatus]